MNNDKALFSLQRKEEKNKSKNYIISWNLKRNFNAKLNRSLKVTAFSSGSSFFEVLSSNSVNTKKGLIISFKTKKRLTTCFCTGPGTTNEFTTEKSTIQVGQGGPSIWIVNRAQKIKNQIINAALAISGSTIKNQQAVLTNHHMKPTFENQIYTFGRYKLQKHFSKIELTLRQGCQLFTIYVVGSFCWLYLIQYSNGTSTLNGSKITFLFQEVLFKNLPLFSEKGIIFEETNDMLSSTNWEKSNLKLNNKKINIVSSSNLNETCIPIELTSSFHEKLQNFYGKKNVKSDPILNNIDVCKNLQKSLIAKDLKLKSPTEELFFFSRKPIFLKDLVSSFTADPVSLIKARHFFAVAKSDIPEKRVKSILHTNEKPVSSNIKNNQIFLQKQQLTQKKIYNLSGTSIKIDPAVDILPRKLGGFSQKIQIKVPENVEKSTFQLSNRKKLDQIISRKFKPHLDLGEKALWCDILIKIKTNVQFDRKNYLEKSLLGGSILKNSSPYYKNTRPFIVTGLKSRKMPPTWLTSNSFYVVEPLQGPVAFTQNKWGVDIIFFQRSNQGKTQPTKDDSLLVCTGPSNYNIGTSIQLLKTDPIFPSIFLKKRKFLKNKALKWTELLNQPRLHSGFNFPNVPILKKNKEKLKEGLGLAIIPQFQNFPIQGNIWRPEKSFSLLNKKNQKRFSSNQEIADYTTIKTGSFNKNPFFKWVYEHNPKYEYISYSRADNKTIHLQKNSARFVILDKDSDIKITKFSLNPNRKFCKKENSFLENVFSSKRKSFNSLLDAPENFFGSPYLKIGERCTIEKIQGKNQISTLYNIHNGDFLSSIKTFSPYASMGTSLNNVFGKKPFQSKKGSKNPNLIANARLVMDWSKESLRPKNISKLSEFNKDLKNNNLSFYVQQEEKNSNKPKEQTYANILKIFSFKRVSGKVNRNIKLPFKYYNPGVKRERNIEDTMLVLEAYKKSRLFPTIHHHYRGIATKGLPIELELDKVKNTGSDIDLQSILQGMRQRTESQRIAENLSEPSNTKITKNSQKKEIDLIFDKKISSTSQNKQKRRLSNYYPLCTSLSIYPQSSFSQKVLSSTDRVESILNSSFNLFSANARLKEVQGSAQTKGFYFEKLLRSKPVLNFIERTLISPNLLGKFLFFTGAWYSYKLLAIPLSQSTQFLPATFTEALGLQSFKQKFRIIKGDTRQTFKNLAGAEKTLSELRDLIWTFRLVGTGSPNLKNNFFTLFPYLGSRVGQFRNSSSKSRNRFLLAGPPGTGKTLLVKALAAEANLPVIVQPVSGLRMISGVENPVSALFQVARQIKPCIIFLDELDTLGNDLNNSTSHSTAEQKLSIKLARKYTYTLLLELDGLTSSTNDLLIIGATNRLETLNPALTRAGRFETILNFNLPSQDVRTVLFSFYLSQSKNNNQLLSLNKNKFKLTKQKNIDFNITNKKLNLNTIFKKTENKSLWLESYLAKKCYGLSHASIGTIINESALDSMLQRNNSRQPLHTVETLERAINSVKTLTARTTLKNNSVNHEKVLSNHFSNHLKLNFSNKNKTPKNSDLSNIKPFQQEFLVNRVYQTVGSLIYYVQEKNNQLTEKSKKFNFTSNSLSFVNNKIRFNQENRPVTRKDLQSKLLQEYSGFACLCIYNVAKPQTLKFTSPSGLYQNPSYIAAIILILNLTHKNSFTQDIAKANFLNKGLNCNFIFSTKLGLTNDNWAQFSGFTSENNLTKQLFLDTSNLETYTTTQKALLFWNNRKVFKKSFNKNLGFTSHSNNVPQPFLLDIKYNPLTTSWFRIYLSRPFFRYDTFHYIENKEYYPKNNYTIKRNSSLRNVSTLSHSTLYDQSFFSDSTKKNVRKSTNVFKLEKQILTKDLSQYVEKKGKFLHAKRENVFENNNFSSFLKYNVTSQSKESVYLAIVASIFHKNIKFFQNKRELTDYCAHIFLRYGMLYEFYLDEFIKRF